ncbi:MAG: dihydrodipicolinate synthase family protein [Alphaproteobacteria bacterium]|nr:dihydrodipicolinate synthase family protein [Alphaproteobacteria bacterium]
MAAAARDLRGIVTVLNTPFAEDGRVDLAALERHAAHAVEAGVVGFLIPGFAAEVLSLSADERRDMVGAVVAVAKGRAAVVGGASAPTQDERCRNAEALARLGCDIVLASLAFASEAQYQGEIRELAGASGRDLMIQDWDASGPGAPVPAVAAAFAAVPAFRYLKVETADAGTKYTALKAATSGKLHVSGGWAAMQLIEALDRKVDAFIPTGLHRAYVTIFNRHTSGDRAGALRLFHRRLPALAFSNQNLEHSIHFYKRLLWRQGIYPTPRLREPKQAFDAYHQRIADELIEGALAIEAELARAR